MANTWYTDVATNQLQGVNFPGESGVGTLTTQPGTQNRPLIEGPPYIAATYLWTGNEAANDTIIIGMLPAGVIVNPDGHVASGPTSPSSTLTFVIGDNDLAIPSLLPIPNPQAVVAQQSLSGSNPGAWTAPAWVSGTAYVAGNVVYDPNSTPANLVYTAVAATSGTTAPHSAANTVWMPNNQRYSNSIDCHAAAGNVAFAGGTQVYGGAFSLLPYSVVPGSVPQNATAAQLLNQQYQIQQDCWLTATIATINATAINANAVSLFRVSVVSSN